MKSDLSPTAAYIPYPYPPTKQPNRESRLHSLLTRLIERQSAWLMSMVVHVALLVLLACFASSELSEGALQFSLTNSPESTLEYALVDVDSANIENPLQRELDRTSTQDDVEFESVTQLSDVLPASTFEMRASYEGDLLMESTETRSTAAKTELEGQSKIPLHHGLLSGRSEHRRAALLKRYGGTPETEAAVRLGLEWLIRQQTPEGAWSFAGPYADAARFGENQVAATSMALLAFLGAGQTHKSGNYRAQIERALRWLVKAQADNGDFSRDTPRHHAMYTHAQATLVLTEAYAMTDDSWLRPYCEKAIAFAIRAQHTKGGWRYAPRDDSDTSVTGWFVVALMSARSAGFEVPEANLRRINSWFNRVDRDDGATYSYMESMASTRTMTAEGLLSRMYLGWERTHTGLDRGASRLLKQAPFVGSDPDYYYWYYATQVMHQLGGKSWEKWNTPMREQLPALQIKAQPELGSWPPVGGRFENMSGRLYCTCMALYCLEVYYRHMPIYELLP